MREVEERVVSRVRERPTHNTSTDRFMPQILGAVLAGGRSRRFGADKSDALLNGKSLLAHAIESLDDRVAQVVVCGGDPSRRLAEQQILPDRPEAGLGPLGGLCAALHFAQDHGFDAVLTVPVDAHPIADDLLATLEVPGPTVIADHWLFGIWPSTLAERLENHLRSGNRSVRSWVEACGADRIEYRGRLPINVNAPQALAALEEGLMLGAGAETHPVRELDFATLDTSDATRVVPVETPIAIEFNGIGYAVMMATPTDLEDFVTGFALAEGLAGPEEIDGVDLFETGGGWVARANLPARSHQRLLERARSRVSESSCGICGIDSVAAALAPIDPIDAIPTAGPAAIRRALDSMRSYQKLGQATGAAHAAAFCNSKGDIVLVREDVGRHNALDKLIGALGRAAVDHRQGFVLLTARCSQELVEKTVRAGIAMLVTISAPSSLAISRAREGRLTLLALARSDTALVVNDPHDLFAKKRS